MDQDRDLSFRESESRCGGLVEDSGDALELDEVVARAGRAQLPGSSLVRPARNGSRISVGQAPERLRALEVVLAADPTRDEGQRPFAQYRVEVGA